MILLLVAVLLCVYSLYIYFLGRSVYFGWISLLAVQFYEFSFGINAAVVGGIHLDPLDVIYFALMAAGVIRTVPRLRERSTAQVIGLGYFSILTFSLVRGSIENGFITASNEVRGFVPVIICVLYFLTAPVDVYSIRGYIKAYIVYGLGFVVVSLLAYAGMHVGGTAWLHASHGASNTIEERLLPAAAALGIALCFFFSVAWVGHRDSDKVTRWIPVVFLGTAVFLRHRSVWNVLLFGVASLLFTDRRLLQRLLPMAVLSVVVIVMFAVVASFTATPDADDAVSSTRDQFSDSAVNQGTWLWRVHVWTDYLFGGDQTISTVAIGKSLGTGYASLNPEAGTWENAPPHSEYVAQYTRVGLLGAALQVLIVVLPLRKLWMMSPANLEAVEPSSSAWVIVMISALIYGVTYSLSPDLYALVGIGSALATHLGDGTAQCELAHLSV